MLWLSLCVMLGVLSLGNPLNMLQSGSIIIVGELFRSTKHWELNRKRKVPEFVPRKKEKKRKKVRRETSVSEGVKDKLSPRIETFKQKFDFFRNKWKDKSDWITERLVDFVMLRFDLWKKKWKDKIRFPKTKTFSKVYFASEYLRENYGGLRDYTVDGPDPTPRLNSIFNVSQRDDMPIVFDTGASMPLTPLREDFDGELKAPPITQMHGLKGAVKVIGMGRVSWTVFDALGVVRVIKTMACLVPEGNIWLFSPQVYFQENGIGS
jgi:hypothetical protein